MYNQIDSNKRKTVFLMLSFLFIVIGMGWVFSYAYESQIILYGVVIFAVVQALVSYYYSDKIALSMSKAKPIKKGDYPELYRIVENLSITAGLPMPKVYVINDPSPNAFATGRDPKHAAVAATTGLLEKLEKKEIEGVMAHEMSHVGNYDIRIMTIVVVLVGIITLLADFFIRMTFYGGSDRKGGHPAIMIAAIALAILSPIFAMLIQLAVSRKREYLADASASLLTRYPEGLASALEKISKNHQPAKMANKATAHLFISDPTKREEKHKKNSTWTKLFSTHPPVGDRIAKLRGMIK